MRRIVTLLTLVCFACFLTVPSFAQQDSDIDKILKEGKEAYMNGNFKQAIEKLSLAIKIIKNKEDLVEAYITLALTYYTLGEEAKSTDSVKKALEIKPALALNTEVYSPKFIDFVETAKKSFLIKVTFKLSPAAVLYIDDLVYKKAEEVTTRVIKGTHAIKVEKKGYKTLQQNIELLKNNEVQKIKLEKMAVVKKEPVKTPRRGRVEKEGKKKKKGSALLLIIGGIVVAGVVAVLLMGKKSDDEKDEPVVPQKGTIVVNTNPEGATIILDGNDTGRVTPAEIGNIEPGHHHIMAVLELYGKLDTEFDLAAAQTLEIAGDLQPFTYKFFSQIRGVAYPIGIDLSPGEELIYVASNGAARGYNRGGTLVDKRPRSEDLPWPYGVFVHSNGNVFITEAEKSKIRVYNADGDEVASWGREGTSEGRFRDLGGIVVDSAGNVFVADAGNNRIQVFNTAGTFKGKWGQAGECDQCLKTPTDVAIGPDNEVYVANRDLHRVTVFARNGTFLRVWGGDGSRNENLQTPTGIDVDRMGNVYVVNHANSRIAKFTADGGFIIDVAKGIGSIATRFKEPHDVAVDNDGTVFVTDSANNRIQVFYITEEIAGSYNATVQVVGTKKVRGFKRSTTGSDTRGRESKSRNRKKERRGIEH